MSFVRYIDPNFKNGMISSPILFPEEAKKANSVEVVASGKINPDWFKDVFKGLLDLEFKLVSVRAWNAQSAFVWIFER